VRAAAAEAAAVQEQAADAALVLQAAARGRAARMRAAALREEREASEGFLRGAAVWSLDSGAAAAAGTAAAAATDAVADSGSGSVDGEAQLAHETDVTDKQADQQLDNDGTAAATAVEGVEDKAQAVEEATECDSPQTALAATSIQSSFRGHIARRRAAQLTEKRVARAAAAEKRASAKAADAAAATIQGKVRLHYTAHTAFMYI
jgi:IQ calmodulin-binding motif